MLLSLFTIFDTLHREKRIIVRVRELFKTFVSRNNRMSLCFGGKPARHSPSRGLGSSRVFADGKPAVGQHWLHQGRGARPAWDSGRAAAEGRRSNTQPPCLLIAVSVALPTSFMVL